MTTMTQEDIEAVLDQYLADTGKWDPWINGQMRAKLDIPELDPHAKGLTAEERAAIIERRGAIMAVHQLSHDWMVGQRMAIGSLRTRFREATHTPDPIAAVFAESWTRLEAYFDAGGRATDLTMGPIEVIPNRLSQKTP